MYSGRSFRDTGDGKKEFAPMNNSRIESTESLKIDSRDGVTTLSLHRPERRNALDRNLVLNLGGALSALGQDPSVRVLILRGSGEAFCAGADLSSIENPAADELGARIDEFHALIRGIVSTDKPVIALVDGPAVGFGADLALACDLRVFSDRAYLEEGFVKIGLMPDGGGTHWLRRFCGPLAFEFLALGKRLSAVDCARFGIANQVVAAAELLHVGETMAEALMASAPLALAKIKRSLRQGEHEELEAALNREKSGQSLLIQSEDFREGEAAFRNKRSPLFRGC
jgi:enoyl-CoA hydratase/carnithine racemase